MTKENLQYKDIDNYLGIKENSPAMDVNEFGKAVVELFIEKFPNEVANEDSDLANFFDWNVEYENSFLIEHCKEVEIGDNLSKYFPILEHEDVDSLDIDSSSSEYKKFCEDFAPEILPGIDEKYSSTLSAYLGQISHPVVSRAYLLPLKYGFSKKSLEYIKENIFGEKKKTSFDDKINEAKERSGGKTKDKNKSGLTKDGR